MISRCLGGLLLGAVWFAAEAEAGAVLDGTTGSTGSFSGDFEIPAAVGRLQGPNLFHSFERFAVDAGERATFTGLGGIDRVVSRVTGGDASRIDGRLASTIAGADFFFLNPAGVVFGPAARLDVDGSFHVTTADELRFADGTRFAARDPLAGSFTAAAPESFGFLDRGAGGITVDRARLGVPDGRALSLIGGEVLVIGGSDGGVTAPSGRITIVGSGSANDVPLAGPARAPGLADIVLRNNATVDVGGDGSGRVRIDGGRVMIRDRSFVVGDNRGAEDATGSIEIRAGTLAVLFNSAVAVDALAGGDAGRLTVDAAEVDLARKGRLVSASRSGATGDAGTVRVRAGRFELADGGQVATQTEGRGGAGRIVIDADLLLADGLRSPELTGIFSTTDPGSTGAAGRIGVTAGGVLLLDGAQLNSSTDAAGDAGRVRIEADRVVVSGSSLFGDEAGIRSEATEGSSGDAGNVVVIAGMIEVGRLTEVGSSTAGAGDAGNVRLEGDDVLIRRQGLVTSVSSETSTGGGGRVEVEADRIRILSGGQINAFTKTARDAGRVRIEAGLFVADGRGSREPTGIFGTADEGSTGDAGTVRLVGSEVRVLGGAEVSSSSRGPGSAGDVRIDAADVLVSGTGRRGAQSGILSEAEEGSGGAGGDVRIRAEAIRVRNEGAISSSTETTGDAGAVRLATGRLLVTVDGLITSTATRSSSGDAGTIHIDADVVKVTDGGQINTITFSEGKAGLVSVDAARVLVDGEGFGGITAISSTAERRSTGPAGSIEVRADEVELRRAGELSSQSDGSGRGGDVTVRAQDSFSNLGGAVTARTVSADAGDIRIVAGRLIHLADGTVTTSAAGGTGGGGNILLDPDFIVLNDGEVVAQALAGAGGDIVMVADNLTTSPGSVVDASSELGIDGTVSISGPDTDLTSDLAVLSTAFVDVSSLLGAGCEARAAGGRGSLTSGGGVLPPGPDAPLSGDYAVRHSPATFSRNLFASMPCP